MGKLEENWIRTARQRAVGRCPACGRYPTRFIGVPLAARCAGPEGQPHPEMIRVVPGAEQPYGRVVRSRWKGVGNEATR